MNQVLFHGSNRLFDRPDLGKSRDHRDFGKGFYTTTIRPQAEDWAKSLHERYGGPGAFLYRFALEPVDELRIRRFGGLTVEWLDTVRDNRVMGGVRHDFDVVMGPVADDRTMPTIALYVDGLLGPEAALAQLAYYQANDQVSFHTQRAMRCLLPAGRTEL
ncbi:MAG: DUF3990 domain-containing protein [Bifidobacteriaceae bacterium]|nr:DUF3990 domain-containing protein [Bifidobacteriaceae bacterium]